VSQVVEVSGVTPLLQTETTEISTHIDHVVAENIPLLTRNYGQLTLLTRVPLARIPERSCQVRTLSSRPSLYQRQSRADQQLHPGWHRQQSARQQRSSVLAESRRDSGIQPDHPDPSAEFGNFLGGILNTSIKSGTNDYHGSAYEFLRNDKLNANSWSNNLTGVKKAALRYNQFGATVGGPIIRNRLFFFADYQGLRNPTSSTQQIQVLSAAERTGDLGELCTAGFNGSGICADPPSSCSSRKPTRLPPLEQQSLLTI